MHEITLSDAMSLARGVKKAAAEGRDIPLVAMAAAKLSDELESLQAHAKSAEEELRKTREQEPAWMMHENGTLWSPKLALPKLQPELFTALYARPVPANPIDFDRIKTVPAMPTDEQIHAAYRKALGQSIRERDMPEIRKFARALLQSAQQPVAYGIDDEAARRVALAVHDYQNRISDEPLLYAINRILIKEVHPLSADGLAEVQPAQQPTTGDK